jgi:RNA 2',3'-cyclic 3'-phosphodiesterase
VHPRPPPPGSRLSRLFAAVDGSAAAYDAIAACLPPAGVAGAPRWSARPMWHVTVVFIGAYEPQPLLAPLAEVAAAAEPFTLRFRGCGVFPERGRPRVFWAGVAGDLTALHALAGAARDAAVTAGAAPDDRPYRPHLTLGLWRAGEPADARCAPELAGHTGPPFAVSALTLYRSDAGRYEPLARFPLGAHGGDAASPSRRAAHQA